MPDFYDIDDPHDIAVRRSVELRRLEKAMDRTRRLLQFGPSVYHDMWTKRLECQMKNYNDLCNKATMVLMA